MESPKIKCRNFDFLHKNLTFFLCIIPNLIKSPRTNKKYIDKFENFLKILKETLAKSIN